MLWLLFLYFSIHPHAADKVPTDFNCPSPPEPKNGFHIVTKTEKFYYLKLFCDNGFGHLGQDNMTCFGDGWISGNRKFECLPYCEPEEDGVLFCGQTPRCIVPGPVTLGPQYNTGDRNQVQEVDAECGVVLSPSQQSVKADSESSAPYITGGRKANREEIPWHAGIYTKKKLPYLQICGGSLVSHTVVISAAHCFWNDKEEIQMKLPASDFAVAVGKLFRPWNDTQDIHAQKSNVAEIKIPQYFRGHETNLQDDIALVIVASPFSFINGVRPVCLNFNLELDKKQLAPGKLGKVAGWGLTSEDGKPSPVLNVVELPVVDINQCFQHSDPFFRSHITSDKICAGYKNGTAVCKGDSGGGLSFPEERSGRLRYYLRGIVSGSPQSEHLCNTLAWASFTHLLAHEHFIRETVTETATAAAKAGRV